MRVAAKIAILGAQGSGKSWLACRLSEALAGHHVREFLLPEAEITDFDWVLLMGLDLALAAPAMSWEQHQSQQAQDQRLRDGLAQMGRSFQVIYGEGDTRLQHALGVVNSPVTINSVASHAVSTRPAGQNSLENIGNWHWPCETCSDPDCERHPFSRLLQTAGRSL